MRAWLILLLVAGCGKGQGILEVRVSTLGGEMMVLDDVDHLVVTVNAEVDGRRRSSMSVTVDGPHGRIPPAVDFALRFGSDVSGTAVVTVSARDAVDGELASAQANTVVTPSEIGHVSVYLPGQELPTPDLSVPKPDLAQRLPVCGDGVCEASESCSCSADCKEDSAAACKDSCDNDGDGYTDCNDFDCCPLLQCPTNTSCGARQACMSAGSSCTGSCPAGTQCVFRLCDGVLECQYTDVHCYTVNGVACPKVSLYDVCTQPSDCAAGANCETRGGSITRCWPAPRTVAGASSTCPADFCPSNEGGTRDCISTCDASSCTFTCELACTSGSTPCPSGLICNGSHCTD